MWTKPGGGLFGRGTFRCIGSYRLVAGMGMRRSSDRRTAQKTGGIIQQPGGHVSTAGGREKKVLLWLDRLFKHLGQHFACEEAILSDIGFPDAAEHATEHKQLLDKTLQIQESYLRDEIKASAFFSFIVDDVIMGHMIQADSCFFPFIKAKNEK